MKFSEKIQHFRYSKGYSQEELADICGVSRQSVSKWELGLSLPSTESLIILSSIFNIEIDEILEDEIKVDKIKLQNSCGVKSLCSNHNSIYSGILIKESIDDENVLDYIRAYKVELWNTGGNPKYWTAIYFTSEEINFPYIISRAMISNPKKGGNWFVDFKSENEKYIVFRNKILKYKIGNIEEKQTVIAECRNMGISDEQMQWSE